VKFKPTNAAKVLIQLFQKFAGGGAPHEVSDKHQFVIEIFLPMKSTNRTRAKTHKIANFSMYKAQKIKYNKNTIDCNLQRRIFLCSH
jgi:hypothetical protein